MKSKEALNEIRNILWEELSGSSIDADELCNPIKSDLEVLDIIITKKVVISRVNDLDNAEEYNWNIFVEKLTEEEYEKIKARLKK